MGQFSRALKPFPGEAVGLRRLHAQGHWRLMSAAVGVGVRRNEC
jgi:hypothetical protein